MAFMTLNKYYASSALDTALDTEYSSQGTTTECKRIILKNHNYRKTQVLQGF